MLSNSDSGFDDMHVCIFVPFSANFMVSSAVFPVWNETKSKHEMENLWIIDGIHAIHTRNELNEQTIACNNDILAYGNDVPKLWPGSKANAKNKCEKFK